ncbi:MAG: nucleotidyltransferase [Planctomycetes bacterium]|nr:nucleotidyltransferase [Planctomycetota bacterium]
MLLSRDEVFWQIDQHQVKLRGLGVSQLQLFGSVVRDEAEMTSDLDFVVSLKKNTFDSYMEVKHFLEDLFSCSVDLVLADTIKPALQTGILQEAVHAPGF